MLLMLLIKDAAMPYKSVIAAAPPIIYAADIFTPCC